MFGPAIPNIVLYDSGAVTSYLHLIAVLLPSTNWPRVALQRRFRVLGALSEDRVDGRLAKCR